MLSSIDHKLLKMKLLNLILIGLLFSNACLSQESKEKISINIPSVEQEATSIWRTINDINFFERQGYTIHLPKASLIDALIVKSKNGDFGNDDFSRIYDLLESKIYNSDDYQLALKKVEDKRQLMGNMVQQIETTKAKWDWNFKSFESYRVVFTLYGTGGSYDPDAGIVTLFTNTKGDFMNYDDPENTIIHEIVHIGIEQSIIQKYQLSHGLKERIVDTFVFLMFSDLLPEYKIQNMGDPKIGEYLKQKKDLKHLATVIEKYKEEK